MTHNNVIPMFPTDVVKCDHADDDVPCCSACFHTSIYIVCREAGIPQVMSDIIANQAMNEAVIAGQFSHK